MTLLPITNSPSQFEGYSVRLSVDTCIAGRISLYKKVEDEFILVLGKDRKNVNAPVKHISDPLSWEGEKLFVEVHEFAGIGFNGVIAIEASFLDEKDVNKPSKIIDNDTVIMAVSPWIMTSHTHQ